MSNILVNFFNNQVSGEHILLMIWNSLQSTNTLLSKGNIVRKIIYWIVGHYDEDHEVDIDLITAEENFPIIEELARKIKVNDSSYFMKRFYIKRDKKMMKIVSFIYKHYFLVIFKEKININQQVTRPIEYIVEFGSEVLDEKRARVSIKRVNKNDIIFQNNEVYIVKHGKKGKILVTNTILDRLKHVSGMQNYDLILRNCEHIANFIAYGLWLSQQVNEDFNGLN